MTVLVEDDASRKMRVDELTDQLLTVMLALPARVDGARGSNTLRKWAHLIAQTTPWQTVFYNGMKNASRGVTRRELEKFSQAISNAQKVLEAFHNPSFGVALELDTSVHELRQSLEFAKDFAVKSSNLSLDHLPEKIAKGKTQPDAQVVAGNCAFYYYWITGKLPTVHNADGRKAVSPFEKFVGQVFEIMQIDASPAWWARKAGEMPQGPKLWRNSTREGG